MKTTQPTYRRSAFRPSTHGAARNRATPLQVVEPTSSWSDSTLGRSDPTNTRSEAAAPEAAAHQETAPASTTLRCLAIGLSVAILTLLPTLVTAVTYLKAHTP